MGDENFTIWDCNLTDTTLSNNSLDEEYGIVCLNKECMPVVECTKYIEQHVRPGVLEWIIIAIYSIIFFVGLFGNGLVCFVVFRTSHMRTVINIFIVNLAFADFLVLLVCLPPSLLADTTESWYLGGVMCKIVPFLQTVSVSVSVLTLGAIAIERYFAICHPLRRRFNALTVILFIVAIWIASILVALPELLFQNVHRLYPEHVTNYLQYCKQDLSYEDQKYYQIFLMVGLYDFPMCLMFFAYTTISIRLWRDTFSSTSNSRMDAGRRRNFSATRPENQLHARRKAAKMLMAIVILFACCYLPIHVWNILRYSGTLYLWSDIAVVTFALVSRGLCYLNSAINPIILDIRYSETLYLWSDIAVVTFALVSRGMCYLNSAINPIILDIRYSGTLYLWSDIAVVTLALVSPGLCYLNSAINPIILDIRYSGTLYLWSDIAVVTFALVSRGLCYLNSAINPIIYNFMSAKFRQEFRAAFGKCYSPFQESTKTPVTLYNFRVTRSNGHTRSERYSMNTLTTRQGWVNNQTNTTPARSNKRLTY